MKTAYALIPFVIIYNLILYRFTKKYPLTNKEQEVFNLVMGYVGIFVLTLLYINDT
jgi:hypothetical protein